MKSELMQVAAAARRFAVGFDRGVYANESVCAGPDTVRARRHHLSTRKTSVTLKHIAISLSAWLALGSLSTPF